MLARQRRLSQPSNKRLQLAKRARPTVSLARSPAGRTFEATTLFRSASGRSRLARFAAETRSVRQQTMSPRFGLDIRLAACIALAACTASWGRLVRYSDEEAPLSESPVVGVYVAVLREFLPPDSRHLVLLTQPAPDTALWPLLVGIPPKYWADTLKREVRAAVFNASLGPEAPVEIVREAASVLGIQVTVRRVDIPLDDIAGEVALQIFRAGLNPDSTIAAVLVRGHGFSRDAGDQLLLLARRPGFRWRIWPRDYGGR